MTSLTRQAGENVGSYNVTAGAISAPSANYSAGLTTTGSTLSITSKAVTGAITNQSKSYGNDDPSLAGIAVSVSGVKLSGLLPADASNQSSRQDYRRPPESASVSGSFA